MAASVNAVTALSADFYKFRTIGTVVYRRRLCRFDGASLDTCFVNGSGDLLLVPRGTLTSEDEASEYIARNDVLFSLCFGPIMVEDGLVRVPDSYPIGEINDQYSRCCICQVGALHYLLVTANGEPPYAGRPTLRQFAEAVCSLGVRSAYALDGGQTATMYAGGQLINSVDFGYQRMVSDIIYFATAYPEEP